MAVGGHVEIVSGEGADEDEKAGLGQVEICQHCIDSLELEAGVDEEIRLAGVAGFIEGLDGADGGGADGDDALCFFKLVLSLLIDFEAFVVEFVVFDDFRVQGLEGSQTDVKGYLGTVHLALAENFLGKVEAGGGGGHAAAFAGEDGLVTLGVGCVIGAANVGRERDVAMSFDCLPFVFSMESDAAFAVLEPFLDDGVETGSEFDESAGREFAAGTDEGAPGIVQLLGEKNFHAAGVAGAMADKAGLEDAGVVEDEEVAVLQVGREVAEQAVLPGLGSPVEY